VTQFNDSCEASFSERSICNVVTRLTDENGEAGFALVLTLVVILALSLVTEVMTRWVSAALDLALTNRDEVDVSRRIADAVAVSIYLIETRPFSVRGIELLTPAQLGAESPVGLLAGPALAEHYLRLDDQPYRLGDTLLRFQDMRGLINLNLGSSDDLFALLGIFGVDAEDRGPLIAKLQDYIDADSLVRLNGAEAPQYEEAGLEPPANAPLRTPWEVRRILDWDKIDDLVKEDGSWSLLTSTAPVGAFNVNTAPRTLLSLMPGMTPETVEKVIEWRRGQPIVSGYQFGILTGIPISDAPPSRFVPFPANGVILTLSTKNSPLERRIAVRKTPLSPDRPWTIDYDVETPRAARDGAEPNPDELPLSELLSTMP
jgi:general secretion pathway protein K